MNTNIGKEVMENMEFLVNELHKEWDRSGENKVSVSICLEETEQVNNTLVGRIALYQKGIEEDTLSFEELMYRTRKNYILLRMIKKIQRKEEKANRECLDDQIKIYFDQEEFEVYQEIFE